MGFSRQEYWSGLPFPSLVDHMVSDLSIMPAHLGWPHRAWLSFIELDKAVVLVWLDLLVFCEYGFLGCANKNGPVGLYALAAPCYSFFILFLFFILLFEIGLLNLRLHSEYWITDHSNLVISHLRKTSAFLWHAGTKLWKNNSLSELCPVKWAVGRLYNVHSELT